MPGIKFNQLTREIEMKGSESFIESNFDKIRDLLIESFGAGKKMASREAKTIQEPISVVKANEFQKVYFHKLGTEQSADQLIINDPKNPKQMFGAGLTDDKRFMIISKSIGTHGNALDFKDLSKSNSTRS